MASGAISAGDLTKLRSAQQITNMAIHITPLSTVQSGSVTAISAITPTVELTWDGTATGVAVGQLVKITNGTTLRAWSVIRKAPVGSTLYIAETPLGAPGFPSRIESPIQVGDTVTVYNHYPLWNFHSRIAGETIYKLWDVPYTNQNETPDPVCNVGTWQVARLATGESTARFTLPRDGSNSSFALGSATISTYAWSLPAGVTIVSGYATSDNIIQVDAVAGQHLVSCTLTDSNANTHTAYLWLFVSDGSTTGLSLSEQYGFTIASDTSTRQGREVEFEIVGNDLKNVIYPSAGICMKVWANHGAATQLTDGVFLDTFVGYITNEGLSISSDGDIERARFKAVSPLLYANTINMPDQILLEKASPANWTECNSSLSNPRGYLYYIMKHHCPNMLAMHDFESSHTEPRREAANFNTGSVGSNLQVAATYIAGNLGNTSDGKLILRDNPLYMDNTDRNALAVVISWQDQDRQKQIEWIKRFGNAYNEAYTGAFAYDGSNTSAWLAAKRWYQGSGGRTNLPSFTVTVTEGITRIKEVAGHFLAEQNADIREANIRLTGLQDVIDPAYMLWNRLTLASGFDAYGDGFTSDRMLPTEVRRSWEFNRLGIRLELELGLQPETFGQPGEEIPIANANAFLEGGWSSAIPNFYTPFEDSSSFGSIGLLMANTSNGDFVATFNRFVSSVIYSNLTPALDDETVCDFSIDWNSAYFTGLDATSPLRVYVVTISGTSLNIWRFNDIRNSLIATKLHTYTMADSSCDSEARIVCSETTSTYVAVAWHDQTGTEFGYSSDGGSTWQTKANVGSTVTDTANDNAPLALAVDGNNTIVSAPNATPEYGMYKATSVGGAFSEITNTSRTSAPQPMAKIEPSGTVAYVTSLGGASSFNITFDTGGFSGYTTAATAGATSSVTATGNPGNANEIVLSSSASSGGLRIDLGASYTITNVAFDIKFDVSNETTDKLIVTLRAASATFPSLTQLNGLLKNPAPTKNVWYSYDKVDFVGWSDFSAQEFQFVVHEEVDDATLPVTHYVDNIVITVSGGGGSTLYQVSDYTGSATWTDITPASDEAPERPHDLTIDLIDTNVLETVSGTSNNWYESIDGGTSWTTVESSSTKRTFLVAGSTMLEGGVSEIKVSEDTGTSFTDITGNLSSLLGTIGTIKKVEAL